MTVLVKREVDVDVVCKTNILSFLTHFARKRMDRLKPELHWKHLIESEITSVTTLLLNSHQDKQLFQLQPTMNNKLDLLQQFMINHKQDDKPTIIEEFLHLKLVLLSITSHFIDRFTRPRSNNINNTFLECC